MKLWIAKDAGEHNILYLYSRKPQCDCGMWHGGDIFYAIDGKHFPEVTFENSPMEVELKLIEK